MAPSPAFPQPDEPRRPEGAPQHEPSRHDEVLPGSPLPVDEDFRRLMRTFMAGAVMYSTAVADRLGINATDLHCLNILTMTGPTTATRLASLTGLTSGSVTRLIDRLEAAGYAQRRPDPSDRRRVIVERTTTPAAVAALFGPLARRMRGVLQDLGPDDVAAVARFLGACNPLMCEATLELREGPVPGSQHPAVGAACGPGPGAESRGNEVPHAELPQPEHRDPQRHARDLEGAQRHVTRSGVVRGS